MIHVIERIRRKDGQPHEREARRKGHRIFIEELETCKPMVAAYADGSGVLRTSMVEAFSCDEDGEWKTQSSFVVQTENSVYSIRKEAVE